MLDKLCRLAYRIQQQNKRCLSLTKALNAFDGEGKTTINILNNEADIGLMINGFSQAGFRLNNDMTVLGPMAIFPRSALSWNVSEVNQITEESLSLFTILEPKLDILIIGIGDKSEDHTFYRKLLPFSVKHKISLEVLATEQACATFNFLNSESRCVAAALIPPKVVVSSDEDLNRSKIRYQNLYEIEWP